MTLRSSAVEEILPAADTLVSREAPRDGSASANGDDKDPGDLAPGVDLELDESVLPGGAPALGDGHPAAAPPKKASTGRRKSARQVTPADDAASTPPPVGDAKWMVWGGLTPSSDSREDARDAPVAPPAAGESPHPRARALLSEATYSERKRAMEKIGGVPSIVVDMAASGGLPLYRPEGAPDGVGVVVKPRWRGVVVGAVFE